jgi:hypothetical protein
VLSHPSHFPKTVAAACMMTSPLFLLASAAVSPPLRSSEGAQLAAIAQHPDRDYWFILLGLVGTVLLVPAVLGLMHMLRERAPSWGYIGGGLALLGTFLGLVDWGSELVKWQMASSGADRAQMTALLKRFDDTAGSALPLQLSGLAVLVGLVLLAVGLYRIRAVPSWTAFGLAAGIILNLAGFVANSVALLIIGAAILLAALGWIGRIVLAEPDADWEHTPERPRSAVAAERAAPQS